MTVVEAEKYFGTLNDGGKARFNMLITIALKLGKPIEGAYEFAKTIMEGDSKQ